MKASIIRNAIAKILLNVFNLIVPIIIAPYLARTIDPQLYNEFNKATSMLLWLLPVAGFGIYNYGIRLISRIKDDINKISYYFSVLFYIQCVSSIIVFFLYYLYVRNFVNSSCIFVYYILGFQILANIFSIEWMNEAFENYSFITFKTIIIRAINIICIFLIVNDATDIIYYALIVTCTTAINYLVSFIYVKKNIKFLRISFKEILKMLPILMVMLVLVNANLLFTALDRLCLTTVSTKTYEVSYYVFSQQIVNIITSLINSIIFVTLPRLSYYLKHKEKYNSLLENSSKIYFLLGIPMSIGIAVLSKQIMFIYGGNNYYNGYYALFFLAIRNLTLMLEFVLNNQIIFIHGKEKNICIFYLITGSMNLIMNLLLIKVHYINAVTTIITTCISELVLVTLEIIFIKTNLLIDIRAIIIRFLKYMSISMIFFIEAIIINYIIPFSLKISVGLFVNIILTIIICAGSYIIILVLIKDDALKESISYMKNKIWKRM